jgi:hypothetical protein
MSRALAVFAAVFALYLYCLYPTIAPRDSADMAAAALTLGVAHPPGYPLYALLGRAWLTLLPWGGDAYRLNVLSAAAGAAACAGLFVLVRRRAGALGALTAAALWALSAPLWKFSLLEEKYSLHALFAVALLLLADGEREDAFSRARLSGLVLGLGLVNHQSLLLWIPGVLWLWRARAARGALRPARLALAAAPGLAAGLALYGFLWARLGALGPALATALRAQYGAGTLSGALARPLTPESAGELLTYAASGAVLAVGWPAALAAAAGAASARRVDRGRALGWLLGGALAGPLFVVLSRFDPADWVARSVLEPAFLLPALVLAAFAGEFVGALARRRAALGAAAALVLASAAFFLRAPRPDHRDDFLAEDYARDLRRELAPGAPALIAGDTATFGLRWLGLVAPESPAPDVAAAGTTDAAAWLAARASADGASVSGLGPASLVALGLTGPGRPLAPAGLVQRLGGGVAQPPAAPPRRPRAWNGGDSYARDVQLSYAFSSWLAARLLEQRGAPPSFTERYDLSAIADDPADYRLP